jgi:2-methylcitrate dehydratase PrpD
MGLWPTTPTCGSPAFQGRMGARCTPTFSHAIALGRQGAPLDCEGAAMSTALELLGSHIAESTVGTDQLRDLLELHIVDTLGASIASTATAEGARLLQFRTAMQKEHGGAALALDLATRCALARLSEIDDIHLPSMTTPGSIVIPGALTLAAATLEAKPDDVSAAMLAGYEAMTRLGRAIDGPAALYRGIWPTYFTAPFGIAAVAARLLRLSAAATADALALALTLASPGVGHHNAPTTSRWLAIGNAACSGLAAALAAKHGFTADRKMIDGNFLHSVYGITPDTAALTDALGGGSVLSQISLKPWCAARQTMAATQALKEIIDTGVAPAEIDQIEVSVLPPHRKMIDHGVIAGDRASYLTSVQYCMAAAATAPELLDRVGPADETPPAVPDLMSRIRVEQDERLMADYPRCWPARVRVTVGGAAHERLVTHVPGDPARPFDRSAVDAKFVRFVTAIVGAQKAEQLLARSNDLLADRDLATLATEVEHICGNALASQINRTD